MMRVLRLLAPLAVIAAAVILFILAAAPAEAPTVLPLDSDTNTGDLSAGEIRVDAAGVALVYVPAGTITLGSTLDAAIAECERARSSSDCAAWRFADETPPHTVEVAAFWLDQYEVSVGQYQLCVAVEACPPPRSIGSFTRDSYYADPQFEAYPVIDVTWVQADDFCAWRDARLPTEAEWEYAARGPEGQLYPWGGAVPDETLANYGLQEGDTTAPGSHPAGASWVNAYHLTGNVWEWTASPYEPYPGYAEPVEIPPEGRFDAAYYVQRGGSWGTDQGELRASERAGRAPDIARTSMGFRCARDA